MAAKYTLIFLLVSVACGNDISCPLIYYRSFTNEKQALSGAPNPAFKPLPSCIHELKGPDIAMGVFHCKKYENSRLKSVAETWGKNILEESYDGLSTFLLASKGGVSQGSIYPKRSLIITDEASDNYRSTLAKGILGLAGMYAKNPDAKWFGVVGDDVYIDSVNLVNKLSAFNPNEEWCIADAAVTKKKIANSAWRISGGAPIITSRALTKRLLPFLKAFSDHADRSIVHDLQFTMLMGLKGGGFHKIIHVDGLYSQGPGVYIGCPEAQASCPKTKPELPFPIQVKQSRGALWQPAAYHHITDGSYMRFLDAVHQQAHICPKEHSSGYSVAIGRPLTKFQLVDDELTKYIYFDQFGSPAEMPGVAKSRKKRQVVQGRRSFSNRNPLGHSGMIQVGAAFIAGSMYSLYPQVDWFLIAPIEDAFVNIAGLHSLIDATCSRLKECNPNKPIVFSSDKSLKGLVLASRGAAKQGVLAGQSGLLGVQDVVFRALEEMAVIKDIIAYHKETSSYRSLNSQNCAVVFSTRIEVTAMHWGQRESPQAISHALLRPKT